MTGVQTCALPIFTASEIGPRCQFFTATDNISTYCSLMPVYVEGKSVLGNQERLWSGGALSYFVNTNDSRIKKREHNGYLFDDPDSALTLYTRVFPKETFNGSTDRKSTRLNSSHKPISYAVFCLKKKKNTNTYYTENHKSNHHIE